MNILLSSMHLLLYGLLLLYCLLCSMICYYDLNL